MLLLLPACATPAAERAAVPTTAPVIVTTPPTSTTAMPAVEVLGRSAVANAADAPPPAASAPRPADTVLLVGDSGMVDLAPALEAVVAATGARRVVNSAWPGFGLTRPQFDWRGEWRAIVQQERPGLVIVMLGGWDLDYIESHGIHAYARIVNEALEVLMARGARVEWLAMLPGGGSYLSPVNTVYVQVRDWSRSVDFYDAQDTLRSADGTFRRTVSTMQGELLVRKPDKWHFCPDGAQLVAAAVATHLAALQWLPSAAPGWESGAWRARADIYDDPKGACSPFAF
jgi:hypothetical protein